MTEAELRQAIIAPAGLKDGEVENALIDRLLEDLRGQEDQLPILQHTLLWMWIQEEERLERDGAAGVAAIQLGLADYEELEPGRHGEKDENVKNALSRHGNKILEAMPAEERNVSEIMFRRLVEVEEHSNRLRRPTRCGTVARLAQVSLDVVQRVVNAFRAEDASFIYASRRRVTDDTSIDIMHESLIRQWDTLDRWVRRERASYEVYSDLCRAAQRMGEGVGTLLMGLALSRAQHWRDEEQPTCLWARRYGKDFDAAMRFLTDSEEAEVQRLRALKEAEETARRQEEERLRLAYELEQQRLRSQLDEKVEAGAGKSWWRFLRPEMKHRNVAGYSAELHGRINKDERKLQSHKEKSWHENNKFKAKQQQYENETHGLANSAVSIHDRILSYGAALAEGKANQTSPDIFLSYAREDERRVRELAQALTREDMPSSGIGGSHRGKHGIIISVRRCLRQSVS
jgi:hypothetical protein